VPVALELPQHAVLHMKDREIYALEVIRAPEHLIRQRMVLRVLNSLPTIGPIESDQNVGRICAEPIRGNTPSYCFQGIFDIPDKAENKIEEPKKLDAEHLQI